MTIYVLHYQNDRPDVKWNKFVGVYDSTNKAFTAAYHFWFTRNDDYPEYSKFTVCHAKLNEGAIEADHRDCRER